LVKLFFQSRGVWLSAAPAILRLVFMGSFNEKCTYQVKVSFKEVFYAHAFQE